MHDDRFLQIRVAKLEHLIELLTGGSAPPSPPKDLAAFGVYVDDFGADPNGVHDSTAAIQAAYSALPARGGTLIFDDYGTYVASSLVFQSIPCRVLLQSASLTQLAGAPSDLITTNANFYLVGATQEISTLNPIAGKKALNFAPIGGIGWTQHGDGTGIIDVVNIGIVGGTTAVDTTGIGTSMTGSIAEGLVRFSNMLCTGQTGRSMIIDQSVYYSYVDHVQFNECLGGDIFIGEATETKCYGNIHKPGAGYPAALELAGVAHVTIDNCELYGSGGDNVSPDIHYYSTASDANPSGLIISNNKFGAERDYNFNKARTKILGYNASSPFNSSGPIKIYGNEFDAPQPMGIISIVGNGTTATMLVSLQGGATSTGLAPADQFYIIGTYAGFCVGPHTVTAASGNMVQFASPYEVSFGGGFICMFNPSAIVNKSPNDRPKIFDNDFLGWRRPINETGMNIAVGLRDQGGRGIWRDNNVIGPIGLGLCHLQGGGLQFQVTQGEPGSENYASNGQVDYTEKPRTQNRMFQSSLQGGGLEGGCTLVSGVTDPLGGTTAKTLVRGDPTSVKGMFDTNILFTFQVGCAIEFDCGSTIPLPDSTDRKAYIKFQAQMGPSGCDTAIVALGNDSGNVILAPQFTVTPHWKDYKFEFSWDAGFSTNGDLYFCPGGVDACVADVNICNIQICDAPESSFIETNGTPYTSDLTPNPGWGLILQRQFYVKSGITSPDNTKGQLITTAVDAITPVDVTGASFPIVLTAAQAAANILYFHGALTADMVVVRPITAGPMRFAVVNNTTGGFRIRIIDFAEAGQVVSVAPTRTRNVTWDGTNHWGDGDIVSGDSFFSFPLTGVSSPYSLNEDQIEASIWLFTGALTGTMVIEVPTNYGPRSYRVLNNTSGGHPLTIIDQALAGQAINVPPTRARFITWDGANHWGMDSLDTAGTGF